MSTDKLNVSPIHKPGDLGQLQGTGERIEIRTNGTGPQGEDGFKGSTAQGRDGLSPLDDSIAKAREGILKSLKGPEGDQTAKALAENPAFLKQAQKLQNDEVKFAARVKGSRDVSPQRMSAFRETVQPNIDEINNAIFGEDGLAALMGSDFPGFDDVYGMFWDKEASEMRMVEHAQINPDPVGRLASLAHLLGSLSTSEAISYAAGQLAEVAHEAKAHAIKLAKAGKDEGIAGKIASIFNGIAKAAGHVCAEGEKHGANAIVADSSHGANQVALNESGPRQGAVHEHTVELVQVDDNGNAVLDENGEEIVLGTHTVQVQDPYFVADCTREDHLDSQIKLSDTIDEGIALSKLAKGKEDQALYEFNVNQLEINTADEEIVTAQFNQSNAEGDLSSVRNRLGKTPPPNLKANLQAEEATLVSKISTEESNASSATQRKSSSTTSFNTTA